MTNGYSFGGGAATNRAGTEFAGQIGSIAGIVTDFGGIGGGVVGGAGEVKLTIAGVNGTPSWDINFLTDSRFAPVWAQIKELTKWLIYIFYFIVILKGAYDFVKAIFTVPGIGVPDFSFQALTFGGNEVGAAVWPLVVAAALVIYGLGLGFVATLLVGEWATGGSTVLSNPLASANSSVMAFLDAVFPIEVAVALLVAYFIFLGSRTLVFTIVGTALKLLPE